MPLTLAHPAAVLPLRRCGLPMAALVIGSMMPDVPLFMRWSSGYQVSHSYTGVFTVHLIGARGPLRLERLRARRPGRLGPRGGPGQARPASPQPSAVVAGPCASFPIP